MKKRFLLFSILLVVSLVLASLSAFAATSRVLNADTTTIPSVNLDDTFTIKLSEPRNSNYAWNVDVSSGLMLSVVSDEVNNNSGVRAIVFQAELPGKYTITCTQYNMAVPSQVIATKVFSVLVKDTETISAVKGDTFSIDLPQASAAGYKWNYSISSRSAVAVVSDQAVNASGRLLVFRARSAGSYTIKCSLTGTASDIIASKDYIIKVKNSNTGMSVQKGENFTIELPQAVDSSYSWTFSIDVNKGGLSMVSDSLYGTPPGRELVFEAVKAGTYKITCVQAKTANRSVVAAVRTYVITVKK